MIKYEKQKQDSTNKMTSKIQRKQLTDIKQRRTNKSLQLDISSTLSDKNRKEKSIDTKSQRDKQKYSENQRNKVQIKNSQENIDQKLKDKGEENYSLNQELCVGRLTIKSINSVQNSDRSHYQGQRSEIKGSTNIASNDISTPFMCSPIKLMSSPEIISDEKLRIPEHQKNKGNKTKREVLFEDVDDQNYGDSQKRCSTKKERDSKILKTRKEPSANIDVFMIQEEKQLQQLMRPSLTDEDTEEMPPISPVSRSSINCLFKKDHRFSIRQIQFNLISSLKNSERTSFVSRASSRIGSSGKKKTIQNGKCTCSKGIQQIFNCCSNNNNVISGRSKEFNQSSYSSNSQGCSIHQQYNQSGIVQNTEDFNSEIDECNFNESQCIRTSVITKFVINQTQYSPGFKMGKLTNDTMQANVQISTRQQKQNKLNQFVTKVPQSNIDIEQIQINLNSTNSIQNDKKSDESQTSSSGIQQQDIHRLHFLQTIQALQCIKNGLTMPSDSEIQHLKINLPPPNDPKKTKTIIFDMDETLIHCVDDNEAEHPDVIIPIDFPEEDELVDAGVNIRPYIYQCLEEANKYFQVIVFTASHKAYADAILDQIDPEKKYIQYRLYRDSCVQTKEGFYVKDLRIFNNRDLKDLVIIDNSVYSFAFQIDNGIPIIPFYDDKEDEEMLHLIYYLNCLASVDDVREQNREAFELIKLADQSPSEILNNYTNTNQQMFSQDDNIEEQIIQEENEDTQELSEDAESARQQFQRERNPSSLLANDEQQI